MVRNSNSRLRVAIPARFASTRLPGKPLIDFGGRPMIVLTAQTVSAALPEADVVVAVDDARVAEAVESAGFQSVMTARTWESGTDRVAEVARLCGWDDDDVIINVQGDEPLLPADLLRVLGERALKAKDFHMGTVCVPMLTVGEVLDPNVVKVVVREDGSAITFSRAPVPYARDGGLAGIDPAAYRRHVGVYLYRGHVLQMITAHEPVSIELIEQLEQLRALWLGVSIDVVDWPTAPPGSIDTPADVEHLRRFLKTGRL